MVIQGSKVLVLGGWGLVGMAVCKRLIEEGASELVILSLEQWQAEDAVNTLQKETDIKLVPVWGNMFVRDELKDLGRNEILNNPENRQIMMLDLLNDLTDEILNQDFLYQVVKRYNPQIIVD
jgi:NAD(P)-dependent dehydrogenase (short-subunit alcohol dehydrogenase family)